MLSLGPLIRIPLGWGTPIGGGVGHPNRGWVEHSHTHQSLAPRQRTVHIQTVLGTRTYAQSNNANKLTYHSGSECIKNANLFYCLAGYTLGRIQKDSRGEVCRVSTDNRRTI